MVNHHTKWNRDIAAFNFKVHARRLLSQIEDINQRNRLIIFIAHSFGRRLLKQVLGVAITESDLVVTRTSGILFLGVPDYDTKAVSWGSLLSCTAYWRGSSISLLKVMAESGAAIEQLNESFSRFYNEPSSRVILVKPYIRDFVKGKFKRIG